MPRLAAVVLTAGAARRMGGENKLLKPFAGRPLLAHCLDRVTGLGLAQVIAVTGHQTEAVEALLAGWPVTVMRNVAAGKGMSGSIAAGVAGLRAEPAGVFIVLGDMPLIPARAYRALAAAFDSAGGRDICVPVHDGRRGHPVLFGRRHFPALTALDGDRGARSLLAAEPDAVVEVAAGSAGVLIDLDTQADFAAAERLAGEG